MWIDYKSLLSEEKVQTCHCTVTHQKGFEFIVSLQTW